MTLPSAVPAQSRAGSFGSKHTADRPATANSVRPVKGASDHSETVVSRPATISVFPSADGTNAETRRRTTRGGILAQDASGPRPGRMECRLAFRGDYRKPALAVV